ncbi:MAG: zinc-ribbon domain-containing protein [Bacteroidales bacterium]|nr:zinc-ribbon domain-containing protein [Bacteroidales bacterium]
MALVYCKECGAKISEHAETCPKCGAQQIKRPVVNNESQNNKSTKNNQHKKKSNRWIIWVILASVLLLVILIASFGSSNSNDYGYDTQDTYQVYRDEIDELEALVNQAERNSYMDMSSADERFYQIVEIGTTKMVKNEYTEVEFFRFLTLIDRYTNNRPPEVATKAEKILEKTALTGVMNGIVNDLYELLGS